MKFVKVENYWWEYDENTPYDDAVVKNYLGGHRSGYDLRKMEVIEAESWFDLDWQNTSIWDNRYKTGWVAPNGVFYGCDYAEHVRQARLIHRATEKELEEQGFIKITIIRHTLLALFVGHVYDKNMKPTDAQMQYLSKRKDCDLRELFYLKEGNTNDKEREF